MGSMGWAYINVPKEIKEKMFQIGRQIDKEDLHENGRDDQPHITIKYGLITDDYSLIRECLNGQTAGKAYMGKLSLFENDEYDVLKVTCSGSALHRLHKALNQLPHEDSFLKYNPHAMIAYLKKGTGKKYLRKFTIDKYFEFDTMYFKKADGVKSISINLNKKKASFNLKDHRSKK